MPSKYATDHLDARITRSPLTSLTGMLYEISTVRLMVCVFTEGLHNGKMNSLARSNASIYGNKEDLYDRLKRHAYNGKKGE